MTILARRLLRPIVLCTVAACAPDAEGAGAGEPPPSPAAAPAWPAPRPVSGLPAALAGRGTLLADVAADGAGRLHALFASDADGDGATDALHYGRMEEGAWTETRMLAEGLGTADGARLAVEAGGRVHALWWERRGKDAPAGVATGLVYRAREEGGWSPPVALYREPDARGVATPTVAAAVDCAGALQVVHSTAARGLEARTRTARGWAEPRPLGDAGALTAAWSARAGCPGGLGLAYVRAPVRPGVHAVSDVFTRSRGEDGGWTEAKDVFYDPARYAHHPRLVADGRGERHLVWLQDLDGSLLPEALFHARSADGETWTEARDVTPPALRGGTVWMAHAAPDAAGGVHVLARFGRRDGSGAGVYALRLDEGGWSAPALLAPLREMGGGEAFLAAEPGGAAVHALWKGAGGYRHTLWRPSPPAAAGLPDRLP